MDTNFNSNYTIPLAGFIIGLLQLYITSRFVNIKALIDQLKETLKDVKEDRERCQAQHRRWEEKMEDKISTLKERVAILDIESHGSEEN